MAVGDSAERISALAALMLDVGPELANASDDELSRAKIAFISWEKIRHFAETIQRASGSTVFGFAALTESPLGRIIELEPLIFLTFIAFGRREPATIDRAIAVGKMIDSRLDAIKSEVEAPPAPID